ncbi:MAG TPA: 6-phosphogluconolactonase [Abditibacteriaceae bacterium]|nr:6-phosphogluconolactonase [Abditibacteriaceae bacterium]
MNIYIRPDYSTLCREVAAHIAQVIKQKPACVLGLATGSTPIGVYTELVRLHQEEGLDFSRVSCFNLDEYFPMQPTAPQSYVRFMREHLFNHINCLNWNVPDGRPLTDEGQRRDEEKIRLECELYEEKIRDAGGLDLQLLGIGRTGHIGFNEPGSSRESSTRLVTLDHLTRADAANDFFGLENVPVRAITMGVGTIFAAREIVLMASGTRKATIVREALEGKITSKVPASLLREHAHAAFYGDEAAASQLRDFAKPWRRTDADFASPTLRRRALIAVAQEMDKPLAKLTTHDLAQAGVASMVHQIPSLEAATQEVERDLVARLSDEAHLRSGLRVLCLSPHPDDDVICCGATLVKMVERGNTLTVAYGVSGSNAVRDKDVLGMLRSRHPRLVSYIEDNAPPGQSFESVFDQVRQFIFEREAGRPDAPLLYQLKRIVREGEASDACRKMGAKPVFLDLPFYAARGQQEGHNYARDELVTQADVSRVLATLREVRPQIVLLTGENSDPHDTHELCTRAFERAAIEYSKEGGQPFERWSYRGAWDEYQVWEGDYFSVFDKALLEKKTGLILDHISQLDPVYPGASDPREFYERARDRNRQSARQLQQLGVLPPSRSFDPIYVEVFQITAPTKA